MFSAHEQFEREALNIGERYPGLRLCHSSEGHPYLSGTLPLEDKEGQLVDTYNIIIKPSAAYPKVFPHVFETDGRLPHNIDWHVFPDGHCCIKSVPEEIFICRRGLTLITFIEEQVKPYFFSQVYREINGFFLRERQHGMAGNIEFFEEKLKTKDLLRIAKGLMFIRIRREPLRTHNCFCGSGLKYRKCHKQAYGELSVYSDDELLHFTDMIVNYQRFKATSDTWN